METINYSEARANLSSIMDQVCDSHVPLIITRQNSRPVVMMSLDDYQELDETAYLLRSPANAESLRRSIEQYERGELITVDIDFDAIEAEKD
jgi:antitoxin YefM